MRGCQEGGHCCRCAARHCIEQVPCWLAGLLLPLLPQSVTNLLANHPLPDHDLLVATLKSLAAVPSGAAAGGAVGCERGAVGGVGGGCIDSNVQRRPASSPRVLCSHGGVGARPGHSVWEPGGADGRPAGHEQVCAGVFGREGPALSLNGSGWRPTGRMCPAPTRHSAWALTLPTFSKHAYTLTAATPLAGRRLTGRGRWRSCCGSAPRGPCGWAPPPRGSCWSCWVAKTPTSGSGSSSKSRRTSSRFAFILLVGVLHSQCKVGESGDRQRPRPPSAAADYTALNTMRSFNSNRFHLYRVGGASCSTHWSSMDWLPYQSRALPPSVAPAPAAAAAPAAASPSSASAPTAAAHVSGMRKYT